MKNTVKLSAAILAFSLMNNAMAGGQQTGTVLELRISSLSMGNPTHVLLSGDYYGAPGCATTQWWAIDTETTHGKNLLVAILTAKSSGLETTIWGTGTCNLRGDMETAFQASVAE